MDPIGSISIAQDFFRYLSKKNKWVSILTVAIGVITGGLTIYVSEYKRTEEENLKKNISLTSRIEELNNVSRSLNELLIFIEKQKQELIEYEKTIQDLKAQKNELEPLISADRKTVEALFNEQEKRNEHFKWIDRLISFLIGVVSSIFAALIINFFLNRRKSKIPNIKS